MSLDLRISFISSLITDQFTTVYCKWDLEELWQQEALVWQLYP